jgi:hypothetical protein
MISFRNTEEQPTRIPAIPANPITQLKCYTNTKHECKIDPRYAIISRYPTPLAIIQMPLI